MPLKSIYEATSLNAIALNDILDDIQAWYYSFQQHTFMSVETCYFSNLHIKQLLCEPQFSQWSVD